MQDDQDLLGGESVVMATSNSGKKPELAQAITALGGKPLEVDGLDVDETRATFSGNARLKAQAYAQAHRTMAMANDSGVVVPALFGLPGVYTAQYAGEPRDWDKARRTLYRAAIETESPPRAAFVAALCLFDPGKSFIPEPLPTTERRAFLGLGEVWGTLIWPPRGDLERGLEPIFQPDSQRQTLAEMEPEHRARIDHRGAALAALTIELKANRIREY